MEKLKIIAEDTKNALGTLKEILETPYSVIIRDATIQRFEYSFEIFWKFLKEWTKYAGILLKIEKYRHRHNFVDIEIGNITIAS